MASLSDLEPEPSSGRMENQPQAPLPGFADIWEEARREDLDDSIALAIMVPFHGKDDEGNLQFGLRPDLGWAKEEMVAQFESEVRQIIQESSSILVEQGLVERETVDGLDGRPYSVGPAAQEWPQLLFTLKVDVWTFINSGASLLAWGYFLRDVLQGLANLGARLREQANAALQEVPYGDPRRAEINLFPTLTRADVVALCFADAEGRYAIRGQFAIEAFPRSAAYYSGPDHPAGNEQYLVRISNGDRDFFYLIQASGQVIEHYMVTGGQVSLLTLPKFHPDDNHWSKEMVHMPLTLGLEYPV
jgi:hypothetical protein